MFVPALQSSSRAFVRCRLSYTRIASTVPLSNRTAQRRLTVCAVCKQEAGEASSSARTIQSPLPSVSPSPAVQDAKEGKEGAFSSLSEQEEAANVKAKKKQTGRKKKKKEGQGKKKTTEPTKEDVDKAHTTTLAQKKNDGGKDDSLDTKSAQINTSDKDGINASTSAVNEKDVVPASTPVAKDEVALPASTSAVNEKLVAPASSSAVNDKGGKVEALSTKPAQHNENGKGGSPTTNFGTQTGATGKAIKKKALSRRKEREVAKRKTLRKESTSRRASKSSSTQRKDKPDEKRKAKQDQHDQSRELSSEQKDQPGFWASLRLPWAEGAQESVAATVAAETKGNISKGEASKKPEIDASIDINNNRYVARSDKSTLNAQTMEEAREKRVDTGPQSRFQQPVVPLGTGTGVYPFRLAFERTEMIYPPRDVYPPPLPRLRDADLAAAGRALGLLRYCDVQWIQPKVGKGCWRPAVRDAEWYIEHYEVDRMDSAQTLEYVGDSLVTLIVRTALMTRYPRRSMLFYNTCANFLVSNDVLGHIYIDSNLDKERMEIANILQLQGKRLELQRARHNLTEKEFREREEAPLPAFTLKLSDIHHLRKADLFESYVGGVYLILGFQEASKWCSRLFEPWLDRLARSPGFDGPRTWTLDGEGYARMEQSVRIKIEQERMSKASERQTWSRRMRARLAHLFNSP